MPIPIPIVERIFASALAELGKPSGEHRSYQLGLRLNSRYSLNPEQMGYQTEQGLFVAVWNIVQKAVASKGYAGLMTSGADRRPLPPKIPGIGENEPRYLYQTVVEIRLPDGSRASTKIGVRSDTVMSPDEIRNRAAEIAANYTSRWGDTEGARRVRELIPDHEATVYIISAGRSG